MIVCFYWILRIGTLVPFNQVTFFIVKLFQLRASRHSFNSITYRFTGRMGGGLSLIT